MLAKARLVGAGMAGAMTGIGLGLLIANGDWVPVAIAALTAATVRLLLRRVIADEHRRVALEWLVALSFAGHLALMSLIHYSFVAAGRSGFVTGDDSDYADLSRRLALWLHGESVDIGWSAESYLFGNFVWLETAIFYVFGPQVLIMKVLNVAFMSTVLILLFDMAQRIFSRTAALVSTALLAVYPSVALWSVLNLKDALALILTVIVLWSLTRFRDTPAWRWFVTSYGAIMVLESVRSYVFLTLALLVPISMTVALAGTLPWRRTARYITSSVIASAVLVALSRGVGIGPLGTGMLATLEEKRAWMAVGARTSIDQDAGRSITTKPGDRFVVTSGVATPTTGSPTQSPSVIVVNPGTKLVPEGPRPLASNEVAVRAGDIVVMAGGPQSTSSPQPMVVGDERRPAPQLQTTESLQSAQVLSRAVRYFPQGLAYALFAPFPWAATTRADLLTIPEMLVWYLLLALGIAALWLHRRTWRRWLTLFLYVAALFTVLALGEGNVGTVFRHRLMVIPLVLVFSAPVLIKLWNALTHSRTS